MLDVEAHDVPRNFSARRHGHERPHLVLVLAGGFEEQTSQGVEVLRAGQLRLSRASANHHLRFGDNGATCLIFEAEGAFWSRILNRALADREHAFSAVDDAVLGALAQLGSVRTLVQSRETLLAFGRMIASLEQGDSQREPSWIEDALDALDRGADRSITDIARLLNRDRVHFARSFAKSVGLRPSEYRALRRANSAVSALGAPGSRLGQVALDAGYADQSHMTNDFRVLFGGTPSDFKSPQR